MKALENYKKATPAKWRKVGDSLLLLSLLLPPYITTLPITEHQIIWLNFGVQLFSVAGKVLTNFFSETETP
jgi:hypothetical protein